MNERKGIAIAGTMVADVVKMIDAYPEKGMLAGISGMSRAVGGIVPNVAIDLAVMDPELPIYAYGTVGADDHGEFLRSQMAANGINVHGVAVHPAAPTGFTDVMTVSSTGERTFFTMGGANDFYAPGEEEAAALPAEILHIGYILLMEALDQPDDAYGTRLARYLDMVQKQGIRTSIDVVSRVGDLFREKVVPALRYTDYAIMNEIEACGAIGLPARDEDGKLILKNLEAAIDGMFALGVRCAVVIHCPELGMMKKKGGSLVTLPSLKLPAGFIKGSVGAGDAFCAGCLYGLYRGYDEAHILAFASAAAACNLSAVDSVSGMRPKEEIEKLHQACERISLC